MYLIVKIEATRCELVAFDRMYLFYRLSVRSLACSFVCGPDVPTINHLPFMEFQSNFTELYITMETRVALNTRFLNSKTNVIVFDTIVHFQGPLPL